MANSTYAVVGASSLLGGEILRALEAHPGVTLLPLSEKAAGTEVTFRGSDLLVEELDADAVAQKPDAVIFATGAARSRRWAQKFVAAGVRVVDASSAHRLEPGVALAGYGPRPTGKHLAIPSAAALAAARVVGPLLAKAKAPRLAASLLVPVSGAGQAGVVELSRQTAGLLGGRPTKARRFPHRIAFNVIPEVGETAGSEASTIERAFEAELRRLVGRETLPIAVTALRVPIFFGLTLVLSGSTGEGDAAAELRKQLLGHGPKGAVKLLEGPKIYPMPLLSVGDSNVLVGRIRGDGAGGFQLVATVDALRLVAEAAVAAAIAVV